MRSARANNAASAPAPRFSRDRRWFWSAAQKTSASPYSPMRVRPARMPTRRRLSAMSPFRMWLNSCPITPCSSSRESFCTVPRVTMITASFGE